MPETIQLLTLQSFKGFANFVLECKPLTVLAGTNNSGKSSILEAVELLYEVTATELGVGYNGQPHWTSSPSGNYRPTTPRLAEAAQLWYQKNDSQPFRITAKFTNGYDVSVTAHSLRASDLEIMQHGQSLKRTLTNPEHKSLLDTLASRAGYVPPLGLVSAKETRIKYPALEDAQRAGALPRFWRNYLYWLVERGLRDEFNRIANFIQQTLPAVRLLIPRVAPTDEERVLLEYEEDGVKLDVTSAGSGLRSIANLAVILQADPRHCMLFDEPDAHMHSSLQSDTARILLDFASSTDNQVFVATHSADFLAEIPLENILWVDRRKERAETANQLNTVLVGLGALTTAAAVNRSQANKVLFIEGDTDENVLRQFFTAVGEYSPFTDDKAVVAHLPAGKGSSKALASFPAYMRSAFGVEIKVASLTDNDYDMGTSTVGTGAEADDVLFLQLQRKEIENYLIEPAIVAAAAADAAQRRSQYIKGKVPAPSEEEIRAQLEVIFNSAEIKDLVRYQLLHKYREALDPKLDAATREAKADEWFTAQWNDYDWKLHNSPGKKVLSALGRWCQETYKLTVTPHGIARHILELPPDFAEIHNALRDRFS